MPLTREQQAAITEIAALCGNQQDKDALARILAENDNVRGGFLRQSDYSRRMNEIAAKEKELAESKARYDKAYADNKKWREEEVMPKLQRVNDLEREVGDWKTKYDEAAARINAAGNGEGNVTAEEVKAEVDRQIKALGGAVTPEAITKIVDDVASKKEQEFIANVAPRQAYFAMDCAEVAWMHLQETGKPLDRAAFGKFSEERGIGDPKKCYEEFMKPVRDQKTMDERVAEEVKKKEEEMRAQFGGGIPGSGAVPTGEMGVVQQRINAARTAQQSQAQGQVVPGGAAAAAAEVRQQGKA